MVQLEVLGHRVLSPQEASGLMCWPQSGVALAKEHHRETKGHWEHLLDQRLRVLQVPAVHKYDSLGAQRSKTA